jgi:hypothetical protein
MKVDGGSTDVTTYFQMRLLTGGDATGLTISDFDMQYVRTRTAPVAKVDAVALAAADTAHTDNRGIEVDATDTPGLYRFDWPDAAFAAGTEVILTIKHTSCFTESLRVELGVPTVNVTQWLGTAAATPTVAGVPEVDVTHWIGTAASLPTVAGVPNVNVKTWNDLPTVALPLVPTVAGRTLDVDASGGCEVGSFQTGAITASAIASDAIGSAELATTAVDEVAAAVWAVATRTLTASTNLGDLDDAVLAQIALVKAKTDSLTFTVAGQVDTNIKSVAGTTVTGVGSEADPWGP